MRLLHPHLHLRAHSSPLIRWRAPAARPRGPLHPKTWTLLSPASERASQSAHPKTRKSKKNMTLRDAPPSTRTRTAPPATSSISPLSSVPPLVSARQRHPRGDNSRHWFPSWPAKQVQWQCVLCDSSYFINSPQSGDPPVQPL